MKRGAYRGCLSNRICRFRRSGSGNSTLNIYVDGLAGLSLFDARAAIETFAQTRSADGGGSAERASYLNPRQGTRLGTSGFSR